MSLPVDTVRVGDCLEELKKLPDRSVEPGVRRSALQSSVGRRPATSRQLKVDAVDDDWDRFDNFEAYDTFTRAWLKECRRVLKDNGTLWVIGSYHNIFRVGSALQTWASDSQRHHLA